MKWKSVSWSWISTSLRITLMSQFNFQIIISPLINIQATKAAVRPIRIRCRWGSLSPCRPCQPLRAGKAQRMALPACRLCSRFLRCSFPMVSSMDRWNSSNRWCRIRMESARVIGHRKFLNRVLWINTLMEHPISVINQKPTWHHSTKSVKITHASPGRTPSPLNLHQWTPTPATPAHLILTQLAPLKSTTIAANKAIATPLSEWTQLYPSRATRTSTTISTAQDSITLRHKEDSTPAASGALIGWTRFATTLLGISRTRLGPGKRSQHWVQQEISIQRIIWRRTMVQQRQSKNQAPSARMCEVPVRFKIASKLKRKKSWTKSRGMEALRKLEKCDNRCRKSKPNMASFLKGTWAGCRLGWRIWSATLILTPKMTRSPTNSNKRGQDSWTTKIETNRIKVISRQICSKKSFKNFSSNSKEDEIWIYYSIYDLTNYLFLYLFN